MIDKVSDVGSSSLRLRREEEKEERRQQILDAAEAVIRRDGWEHAHFGEVAKHARLSRSLVYFYFKTRDDLFHAVCGRGLAELERRFQSVIKSNPRGIDQIMAIGRAYYQFALECPLYFTLLSDYQARETPEEVLSPAEQDANTQGRQCLALVGQALGVGIADGSIRPSIGDPGKAAVSIWAFTHGLIQIATKKKTLLEKDLGSSSEAAMEHGFALIRANLATA